MTETARGRINKRMFVWNRDGRCCHYCTTPITFDLLTLDHVVPAAFGGTRANWNLVASCEPCNGRWGDAVQKCDCVFCEAALQKFHRQKKRPDHVVITPNRIQWTSRPDTSVETVITELLRRIVRAREAAVSMDYNSRDAAALRGKIKGYHEAVQLLAVNEGQAPKGWEDADGVLVRSDAP